MKNTSTYFIYENTSTHERRFARNLKELYAQLDSDNKYVSRKFIRHLYKRVGYVNSNDFKITFFGQNILYKALIDVLVKK
jgi:phage anti-repressor protein